MRVAVGADDCHPLVQSVVDWCKAEGYEVLEAGLGMAWPDAGRAVGEAIASGAADRGVVLCWTGTGVSIAANKVTGVRAALCNDAETARGARLWNDANVLALSMRATTPTLASEILAAFMWTNEIDPNEIVHIAQVS